MEGGGAERVLRAVEGEASGEQFEAPVAAEISVAWPYKRSRCAHCARGRGRPSTGDAEQRRLISLGRVASALQRSRGPTESTQVCKVRPPVQTKLLGASEETRQMDAAMLAGIVVHLGVLNGAFTSVLLSGCG